MNKFTDSQIASIKYGGSLAEATVIVKRITGLDDTEARGIALDIRNGIERTYHNV